MKLADASEITKTIIDQNVNITEWSNNIVFWSSNKVTYMDILLQGLAQ